MKKKASNDLRQGIISFFTSEIDFVKHVGIYYKSKVTPKEFKSIPIDMFYERLKKNDKLTAGIYNPKGGALI